jgi:hypothetical protein
MAETEEAYLQECLSEGVCPTCKEPLVDRVGSGRNNDGTFCSLDCYAKWHERELVKRHFERLKGITEDG